MPSERQTYPYEPMTFRGNSAPSSVFDDRNAVPETAMQALMEAAPHTDPEESWDEKQERLGPLRDALESGVLSEREVWVIEALFWRRIGLRSVGQELSLSKTHVARLRDDALIKLRNHLEGTIG